MRKLAGKGPSRAKAQREPHTSIAKVIQDRGRKNSRVKGNRGELDVAKAFSQWSGEIVRRTPGSGGWGGAQEFGTTADLICKKKAFPFHIEVKHREGWTLDDLVTGVRKEHDKSIWQWWRQCCRAAPDDKTELLVFRRNHQPWFVMLYAYPVLDHEHWAFAFNARPPTVDFIVVYDNAHSFNAQGDMALLVMKLETFLRYEPVPKGLKNHRKESR